MESGERRKEEGRRIELIFSGAGNVCPTFILLFSSFAL
jgi:hypothetical protein